MNVVESLKRTSLNELLELMSAGKAQLLESQKLNEDPLSISDNQKLVENIQKAIIDKRAENPPMK